MKCGLVWQSYYPWDVRIEKISYALRDAGYTSHVLAKRRPGEPAREELDGVIVRRFDITSNHKVNSILSYHFPFNFAWTNWISRCIEAEALELLIVRDIPLLYPAYLAAKQSNIPIGLDMAENYPAAVRAWGKSRPIHYLTRSYRAMKMVERIAVRKADFIFVVTPIQVSRLVETYGIREEKVFVVSNTPDLRAIPEFTTNHPAPIDRGNDSVTILYTGGFGPHRGIETMIRATKILCSDGHQVRLRLVGYSPDDTYENQLVQLVRHLGLSHCVTFTGKVPHHEVYREIAHSDICVVPHIVSEHVNTTVPNKLFDYMALAKPCVVSDAKPLRDIVTRAECGVVFHSGDENDLARALSLLISNPELRLSLGRNGQNAVKHEYNWQVDKSRLLVVLEQYRKQHRS